METIYFLRRGRVLGYNDGMTATGSIVANVLPNGRKNGCSQLFEGHSHNLLRLRETTTQHALSVDFCHIHMLQEQQIDY
jgi:hypothetical protein